MIDRTYRDDPYEYMSQEPCDYCPYQTQTYFENHYISETVKCLLGYTNVTCPVEILEKGGEGE